MRGVVRVVLFYEVEVLFFDLLQGGIAWEVEDFVGRGVGVGGPGDCCFWMWPRGVSRLVAWFEYSCRRGEWST